MSIQIKERPIIFSAPMVRAILEGRKTVTRRALKVQPHIDTSGNFCVGKSNYGQDLNGKPMTRHFVKSHCPYGQPGERLWLRESFWHAGEWVPTYPEDDGGAWAGTRRVHYRADGPPPNEPNHHYPNGLSNGTYSAAAPAKIWRARPSIHMPRWASRILLEISDVRVERLQDITEKQALAEGIVGVPFRPDDGWPICTGYMVGPDDGKTGLQTTAVKAFAGLWSSTGGDWDFNPWVWCVSFRRVEQ